MMHAPSIPMTQGAMPAGFAAFLANIGQLPEGGGESPSFDQLLAAAPVAVAPAASAAAAIKKVEPAQLSQATAPTADVVPVESDATVKPPVVTTEPAKGAAAVLAANLLIALNGAIPGNALAAGKPVPARTGTEAEAEGADMADTGDVAAAAPIVPAANLAAVVAAIIPAAAKAAKPVETSTAPADTDAPAALVAARPRDAALPMPLLAGAETQTAKPVEAAPSMAVLFTHIQTQGTAAFADIPTPTLVAEHLLDIDSDGAWIDQLAHDIAATKSDSGEISFRLMPRHLGRLDVAMQMGDEGLSLKMDTHHEATAVIVTAAQGKLVDELRQQGVRVAGAEVTCTPSETGRQSQGQGQGRAAAPDPTHLIETATERAEPRDEDRAADRRGRFA